MSVDICPCENCFKRIALIRQLDIHVWGTDCPYVCEDFNKWTANKEEI